MRTRAIITILISLIVGFILGFLTEGQIVKRERNKWRKTSYSQMFENRIIHIIAPTESQKEQILPIIKSYSQKMSELRMNTGQKFEELRNEMNAELKQYISSEQYDRLTKPRERRSGPNESTGRKHHSDKDKSPEPGQENK
jgi:uncharacterized membrane protein YraQ (UPF0718 family)